MKNITQPIDLVGCDLKIECERTFFKNGNYATLKIGAIELNIDIETAQEIADIVTQAVYDEDEWPSTLRNKVDDLELKLDRAQEEIDTLSDALSYREAG